MHPAELFLAAESRSLRLEVSGTVTAASLDQLRGRCAKLFDEVPEPPLYPRVDDPARREARALLPELEELLGLALSFLRTAEGSGPEGLSESAALVEALRAHGEVLCHVGEGRLSEAEEAWGRANGASSRALAAKRLWRASDEQPLPVYDRARGESRFDPHPAPSMTVRLACPHASCQKPGDYPLAPRYALHRFVCAHCRRPFLGYFGESRGVAVTRLERAGKRYLFKLEELDGGASRVEFEEPTGAEFHVAHRDRLAFLYTPDRELRAVLNLASARLLWIRRNTACFVATAAFGEGAAELAAFRLFRDRVLVQSSAGRALVHGYYRHGPAWAAFISRRRWRRALVKKALTAVHGLLPWP